MAVQSVNLPAIGIGAPFTGGFSWTGTPSGAEPIPANTRIVGQARHPLTNALLMTLDTLTGNLSAPTSQSLQLTLTAAQTSALSAAMDTMAFNIDFRRYDQVDTNGKPFVMPFQISWQLRTVVTAI